MLNKKEAVGNLLSKIADELNITETMMKKADSSYHAVGEWLSEGLDYEICIKPQGSMNLGTVIRPISDKDDYDMDLVCLIKDGFGLMPYKIKKIVGDRLKENEIYFKKLEKEGRRCWTMQYDEFHMDILPCIPMGKCHAPKIATAIQLTHRLDNGIYISKYSDPEAYLEWFKKRMLTKSLIEKNSKYFNRTDEIDDVPIYRQRTPLQKAIQLLKRHRDILFIDNNENAPISIIITTLAALAYEGEENLFDALEGILLRMSNYIIQNNGKYFIENPVMKEENFADKWNENIKKAENFKKWLQIAHKDLLIDPLNLAGLDSFGESYKKSLGKEPVERAIKSYGETAKKARINNSLYVNGTMGGLTILNTLVNIQVKEHTFFGAK